MVRFFTFWEYINIVFYKKANITRWMSRHISNSHIIFQNESLHIREKNGNFLLWTISWHMYERNNLQLWMHLALMIMMMIFRESFQCSKCHYVYIPSGLVELTKYIFGVGAKVSIRHARDNEHHHIELSLLFPLMLLYGKCGNDLLFSRLKCLYRNSSSSDIPAEWVSNG